MANIRKHSRSHDKSKWTGETYSVMAAVIATNIQF